MYSLLSVPGLLPPQPNFMFSLNQTPWVVLGSALACGKHTRGHNNKENWLCFSSEAKGWVQTFLSMLGFYLVWFVQTFPFSTHFKTSNEIYSPSHWVWWTAASQASPLSPAHATKALPWCCVAEFCCHMVRRMEYISNWALSTYSGLLRTEPHSSPSW